MTTAHVEKQRVAEPARERVTVPPAVDIYDINDDIVLVADVPGVARDAIHIELENGLLTLSARRDDGARGASLLREFGERDFHRRFSVPRTIDAAAIRAEYSNGVLTVHLPRSSEVKARRIEVRAG